MQDFHVIYIKDHDQGAKAEKFGSDLHAACRRFGELMATVLEVWVADEHRFIWAHHTAGENHGHLPASLSWPAIDTRPNWRVMVDGQQAGNYVGKDIDEAIENAKKAGYSGKRWSAVMIG